MIDILTDLLKMTKEFSETREDGTTEEFIEWISLSKKVQKHSKKVNNSSLIYELIQSQLLIKNETKELIKSLNLNSLDDYYYLKNIQKEKSIAKSMLINSFNHEIPTGTEIIKRLLKAGLLEEQSDKNDKRIKLVSLSSTALTLIGILDHQLQALFAQRLSALSEDEKAMLLMLLSKI